MSEQATPTPTPVAPVAPVADFEPGVLVRISSPNGYYNDKTRPGKNWCYEDGNFRLPERIVKKLELVHPVMGALVVRVQE